MSFRLLPAACIVLASVACMAVESPAPSAAPPMTAGVVPEADMARALAILQKWEDTSPVKGERKLWICYWSPADREPQPASRERLTRVLKHIQGFYAKEMARNGFEGRSIQPGLAEDGLLDITYVKGTLKNNECSEQDDSDGTAIRKDCLRALKERGIDGERETMVIFCNLAEWDPVKRQMSHHSPYYASGSSTQGTAWQLDSPLLDSDLLNVTDQFLDDGQYGHISVGKYNSIFVGGVCHELGHALGLPHCKECPGCRAKLGTDLMGSGNRTYGDELRQEGKGSFIGAPHALKLAAHPQFSGSVKQMDVKAEVVLTDWRFETRPDGLLVQGRVQSGVPVHAVIGYADPEGNGDYDSEIAAGVPDVAGHFSMLLPHPEGRRNVAASLHFVSVCANGAATASVWSAEGRTFQTRVDAAGHLDPSGIAACLAWEAVDRDRLAGKLAPGSEARAALSPVHQEILRRLDLPDRVDGKPSPQVVTADIKEVALSDCAPASAKTGWRGAHYDRTCDGGALVSAEGPARHGLWAHANAEYVYALGGQWTRLKGRCGPLLQGRQDLTFSVVADGKTIWTSKRKPNLGFDLDIQGVQQLTLRCEAKNTSSAWGGWLEPVLTR